MKQQKTGLSLLERLSLLTTGLIVSMTMGGCSSSPVMSVAFRKVADHAMIAKGEKSPPQKVVKRATTLTMEEVMARTVRYHLVRRMKQWETFQSKQIEKILAQKGTGLTASNHDASRLPFSPSLEDAAPQNVTDQTLSTGQVAESLYRFRSSQETVSQLSNTWDLMDSALNYYYLRQLSSDQKTLLRWRNRIIHTLLQEARDHYWKAVAAQEGMAEVDLILEMANLSVKKARALEKQGKRFPTEVLRYQLSMLEVIRQLEQLRAHLLLAQTELASLIQWDATQPMKLLDASQQANKTYHWPIGLETMEALSLALREESWGGRRIAVDTLQKTRNHLASLLDGSNLRYDQWVEGHPIEDRKKWQSLGIQLAGSLFALTPEPHGQKEADSKDSEQKEIPMAVSLAVMGQTNIAFREYYSAKMAVERYLEQDTEGKSSEPYVSQQGVQWLFDHLAYIRKASDQLLSRLKYYDDYARLQNAIERLQLSVGYESLPYGEMKTLTVAALTQKIRASQARWPEEIQTLAILTDMGDTGAQETMMAEKAPTPHTGDNHPLDLLEEAARTVSPSDRSKSDPSGPVAHDPANASLLPASHKTWTGRELVRLENWQYAVQVSALQETSAVDQEVEQLIKRGYVPLIWESSQTDGKQLNRIWIGLFENRKQAMIAQRSYQEQERKPAFIVPRGQVTDTVVPSPPMAIPVTQDTVIIDKDPLVSSPAAVPEQEPDAGKKQGEGMPSDVGNKQKKGIPSALQESIIQELITGNMHDAEEATAAIASVSPVPVSDTVEGEIQGRDKVTAAPSLSQDPQAVQTLAGEEIKTPDDGGRNPNPITLDIFTLDRPGVNDDEESEIVRTVQVAKRTIVIHERDLAALRAWRYAVQVAALYEEETVSEWVDQLGDRGYPAVVWDEKDRQGETFKKIWIGLYQDSQKARAAREYYTKHEKKQAFITPVNWSSFPSPP